ncbi:MAG: urease accessory protein UreE [Ginsengibacter sp.]
MLITKKYGNIYSSPVLHKSIDVLPVEWYETGKRILHRTTAGGVNVTLKFLSENPNLQDGDILWEEGDAMIVVQMIPTQCIIIAPVSINAAGALCYEIGNRHLPLFHDENELLIPYDAPLHNLLQASEYMIRIEERKLKYPFKTTVLPHVQVAGNDSIPAKVLPLSIT